jgi:hypothetical protein
MAGIFAIIPKIIFAINKSDSFAIKQDALFSAVSLTNIASLLSWDENNTKSMSILTTAGNNIPCDTTTFLRAGGFLGLNTRNCKESYAASNIGDDGESDYLSYNDIDDFNAATIDVNLSSKTKYQITTKVDYLVDTIFSISGNKMTIILDKTPSPTTTNIKKLKTTVRYVGGRGKDKNISSFYYYSTNIGQITLNSEEW